MLFKGTLAYLVLASLAGGWGSTVINTRDGNHAEGVDVTNHIVFSLPPPPPLHPLLWASLVGQTFSTTRPEYVVKPNIP